MDNLKKLQSSKSTMQILSFLGRRDEMLITKIMDSMEASRSTVYNSLKALLDLKLIEERLDPPRRYIKLTQKGRQIAEKVDEIKEILG